MGERIKINAKRPLSTKENSASNKQKTGFRSQSSHVDQILFLQRTIGNQAVQRLIKSGALQAKLRIGQPGDVYEQEADRVADEVMRMPEPGVQRQVEPEEEEEETLQTKLLANEITPLVQRQTIEEEEGEEPIMTKYTQASADPIGNDLQIRLTQSRGSGQPLPERDRSFMERKFGADFSGVRVNTDSNAEQMNRELNARAFTHGRDIYFGASRYNPGTSSGKRLLAHELTHVIQQNNFMDVSDKINTGNLRAHELIHTIQKSNISVPAIKTLEPIKNISKIQNWSIQREYVFIDAPVTVEPGRPPSHVGPATRCPLPSSITPCSQANVHFYRVQEPNLQYRREADGSHVWWDDHFTETGTWSRSILRYVPSTGICDFSGYPLSTSPSSEPSPRPEEGEQTIEGEALEPSVEAEELDTWYRNWRQIYNIINRREERVTLRSNEGVTYEVLYPDTTAQSLGPDGLPYYELYTFDLVNMETRNLQTINLLQIARRNFDTVYEVLDLQPIEEEEEEELRRQSEEEEEEELLQTKEISGHNAETTPDFESRINAIRGGGQPLAESERSFFEPLFGYDFSQVRIHSDSRAAEMAETLNARAFTVGQDVVFGIGQYMPKKREGQRLLAHELTHIVQQRENSRLLTGDAFEQETAVAPTIRILGRKLLQRDRTPVELSESELQMEIDRLDAEIAQTEVADPRWSELVERAQALHEELTNRFYVRFTGVPLPGRPSGADIEIVSPGMAHNVLYIDATPHMPEFRSQIQGIDPDPTPSVPLTWRLVVVETVRSGTCPSAGIGRCHEDLSEQITGGSWRPDVIQGGDVALTVSARVHGEELTGDVQFHIQGDNPSPAEVTARAGGAGSIGDLVALAESGRQQFRGGMPDFGRGGDVGVMQLCNPPATCLQRWDWRENVDAGLALIRTKRAAAIRYLNSHRNSGGHYPNDRRLSNNQVILLETLQRYRGVPGHGRYWRWNPGNSRWEADPPNAYAERVSGLRR